MHVMNFENTFLFVPITFISTRYDTSCGFETLEKSLDHLHYVTIFFFMYLQFLESNLL